MPKVVIYLKEKKMEIYPIGLKCMGYEQLTVSTTAVSLTVPAGTIRAVLVVEDQDIRYRLDGTDPTATVGFLAKAAMEPFELYGNNTLADLSAIRDGGTDGVLSVHYYGK